MYRRRVVLELNVFVPRIPNFNFEEFLEESESVSVISGGGKVRV